MFQVQRIRRENVLMVKQLDVVEQQAHHLSISRPTQVPGARRLEVRSLNFFYSRSPRAELLGYLQRIIRRAKPAIAAKIASGQLIIMLTHSCNGHPKASRFLFHLWAIQLSTSLLVLHLLPSTPTHPISQRRETKHHCSRTESTAS